LCLDVQCKQFAKIVNLAPASGSGSFLERHTLENHYPRCLKIVSHSADGNLSAIDYYAEGVGRVWAVYERKVNHTRFQTFVVRTSDVEHFLRSTDEPTPKELERGFDEMGIPDAFFFEITNKFKKEKGGETYFVYDIHVRLVKGRVSDGNVLVGFVKRGAKWYTSWFTD